jgi:dTDP-4-amino-4,6-dideoxygalactose transaminase
MLDFTEVDRPYSQAQRRASLAESLRQSQITDGQRVFRLETDLREVLSTSAELVSASETSAFSAWSYGSP